VARRASSIDRVADLPTRTSALQNHSLNIRMEQSQWRAQASSKFVRLALKPSWPYLRKARAKLSEVSHRQVSRHARLMSSRDVAIHSSRDAMKHVTHGANSICLPSSRVTLTSCIGPRVDIQRSLLIGSNSAALFRKGARQRSQNHHCKALARRLRSRRREVTVSHAGLQAAAQPWVAHDVTATVLAAAGAYVWVKLFDWMATRGLLEQV